MTILWRIGDAQDDVFAAGWRCKKPASSRISIVCQNKLAVVGLPSDFLWGLALANFMRLSLMKAAHGNLIGAACRKSGLFRPMYAQANLDWAPVQGRGPLQGVLGTRLDQGEKLSARVLLVEDSHHRRGHG
jgi:hypothetical protein